MTKYAITPTRRRTLWSLAARIGVATLIVRAVIPLGYMPGDVFAGEFVVLCPAGVPAEVMQALHRGHHDHDKDVVDVDQSCPIGTALQPAWIPLAYSDLVAVVTAPYAGSFYRSNAYVASVTRRYDSRGPPIV